MPKKSVESVVVATIRLAGAPAPMQEREFKHRADAERWLDQQREIADRRGWGGYRFELVERPGSVRSAHATKRTPAKQLSREIAEALSKPSSAHPEGYRVAYVLVTHRGPLRAIVDAPRALTLAEAEKWRRQWGRTDTAWVETMAGEFVPVTGAKRPGKFVDDARSGDVHWTLSSKSAHSTKRRATEEVLGVDWSDLAPTGIRVQTHSGDMPLEDATPVEIRKDMNRRLSGYRALTHVPFRRKKWALAVYELAQAKPWVMDQVPHDVWGLVLADVGRGPRP